jgi:hypothetical protein
MSEMIKRVADAVGEVLTRNRGGHCLLIASDEDLNEIAAAAIKAMREPTWDMICAGEDDDYTAQYTWYHMIDAALK